MSDIGQSVQADKLQQMRRRQRLPALVAAWNALGVRPSPVSDEQHRALVAKLSAVDCPLEPAASLHEQLQAHLEGLELACIIDFDLREHPAILVPAGALLRFVGKLEKLYPNGFLVVGPEQTIALLVSFDEDCGLEIARLDVRDQRD